MSGKKAPITLSRWEPLFTVAPSPLNTVKFELGVVWAVGVLVFLINTRVATGSVLQILLLLSYGVLSAAWIIVRARRVMLRVLTERERDGEK